MWLHCNDKTVDAITKAATDADGEIEVELISANDAIHSVRLSRSYGEKGWTVAVPKGHWFRMVDGQPEVRRTTPPELVDMDLGRAESLEQAVTLCVGAASMCWSNMYSGESNAGIFEDERAVAIVHQLTAYIDAFYMPRGTYTTEIGGQLFTQAQWEAVQKYTEGRQAAYSQTTIEEKLETLKVPSVRTDQC